MSGVSPAPLARTRAAACVVPSPAQSCECLLHLLHWSLFFWIVPTVQYVGACWPPGMVWPAMSHVLQRVDLVWWLLEQRAMRRNKSGRAAGKTQGHQAQHKLGD